MDKNRHNWTFDELNSIYHQPLLQLIAAAHAVHREHHDLQEVQVCTLISIKTGGCPEDCKYCTQSSRYQTETSAQPMMTYEEVLDSAKKAIANGATRICLGAAWREVRDSAQFEQVLAMVKAITELGAEVCCTLGMLKEHQAKKLKEVGLYAYNHNLDTSEEFYKTIITTRTYQDRLRTLDVVDKAGISVCCGAILGMGETVSDRLQFLLTLSARDPHPESTPLNRLIAIPGTPLEKQPLTIIWELIRMVAATRIVLPRTMIRLSCGRLQMTDEQQALCFLAGVNSVHSGERLLTLPNKIIDHDQELFQLLGIKKRAAFKKV